MKIPAQLPAYLLAFTVFFAMQAHATLISGNIISAPGSVFDDAALTNSPAAFDEIQEFTLLEDLLVDGGVISAGTVIDSHMIFLNPPPGNTINFNEASWRFDGQILGVMSDVNGELIGNSNGFLGALDTLYPPSFDNQGMEIGEPLFPLGIEGYSIVGDFFSANFRVSGTDPGDWLRVITVGETVSASEPAILVMLGFGLLVLGAAGRLKEHGFNLAAAGAADDGASLSR